MFSRNFWSAYFTINTISLSGKIKNYWLYICGIHIRHASKEIVTRIFWLVLQVPGSNCNLAVLHFT